MANQIVLVWAGQIEGLILLCPILDSSDHVADSMAASENKRKRMSNCMRCTGNAEWVAEEWEHKKVLFDDLGKRTVSSQASYRLKTKQTKNHDLTVEQKRSLFGILYENEECRLCQRCFSDFTGKSKRMKRTLDNIVQHHKKAEIFLDPVLLQNSHVGFPTFHKTSADVKERIKDFCNDGHLHWDPRSRRICFNSDVNSWSRLFAEFVKIHNKLLCRRTFQTIVRSENFPNYKIGRQQHSKDVCDVCFEYWKEKKNFLHSAKSLQGTDVTLEGKKQSFLLLHQNWNGHLEFAYNERKHYRAKALKAKKERASCEI